jgi:predicted amidohydrolase YtcJ
MSSRTSARALAACAIAFLAIPGCSRKPVAPEAGTSSAALVPAEQAADTIYSGGYIVTVNDAQPSAEAVAVKDGRILAVGARAEIEQAHQGATTRVVDLAGRTLVPGFVDGHAHFLGFGSQAVGANLLAPPDGTVNTIDDLVARLQEFAKGADVKRTGWIFGLGYDDALLGRHPNRDDLDKVSKDIPVVAVHISGHFSAVNSAALAKIGYTAETRDPVGGLIRRRPGSREPLGVNEENAHFSYMLPAINASTPEDKDYFLQKGLELAKSYGYTTTNEGRLMAFQAPDIASAAARGLLDIDVMSYADYTAKDVLPAISRTYKNHYRVAGMKITLDGSPQGRTAWRTVPYLLPPEGQKADYKGYPAIPDTKIVAGLIDEAYQRGWPVHVHANGDAAIDQLIEAVRPAQQKYGSGDRRHTLIHGQFLRKDQIPVLKELQIFPSLFPMHTFYWGDWYDQIIGPELAQQISPMRSVLDAGMIATSHTDAPVALPNLMQVMWATVNRTSRSGKVMGADERLTPLEALKAITIWGAYEHFEDDRKGSIEPGKLADLVILDKNPLTVDPTTINQIVVLETIKEGKTVYSIDRAAVASKGR